MTVEVRAAGAYGRAEALVTPIRRDLQPARPTFADAVAPRRTPTRPDAVEPDTRDQGGAAAEPTPTQRRASPLGQPFTAFVAQALAQADDDDTPPPSAFRIGTSAYGSAGTTDDVPDVRASSPFPRLASGRTLDLTV